MLLRWFNSPDLNDVINRRLAKLKVLWAMFPDIHPLRVSKVHLWVRCSNKPQHGKSHPKTEKKCYFVPHKKCGSKWKAYRPQLIRKQPLTPSRESGTGGRTPSPDPPGLSTEPSGIGWAISLRFRLETVLAQHSRIVVHIQWDDSWKTLGTGPGTWQALRGRHCDFVRGAHEMRETEPKSSTLSEGRSAPLLNMESGCRQTSGQGMGYLGWPATVHSCLLPKSAGPG